MSGTPPFEEDPVRSLRLRHTPWTLPALAAGLSAGTAAQGPTPRTAPARLGFAAVRAGFAHTCGLTAAGAAYCWGDNTSGQLGDGTTTSQSSPVLVAAPAGVSFAAVSGGVAHTCGVTAAGIAYCWGRNLEGQLGDGTTTTNRLTPVLVQAPAAVSFAAVGAGDFHTCGVTATGAAYCWGANGSGQLGDGTNTTNRLAPVLVKAPAGVSFAAVTAGAVHTCGVTAAGTGYCWGRNAEGQLGGGTTTDRVTPARAVPG